MGLVLREKKDRNGVVKRFDVVRANNHPTATGALQGIEAGVYHHVSGSTITRHRSSYRTVQDITPA